MSTSENINQDHRPVRLSTMPTRPTEPEHLPCPRCDSTNTKFCYYNNYNLSQPRHFCKSCRRYWTRGGTLRNVPVGGGSRKSGSASSNKRPRPNPTSSTTTTTTTSAASSSSDMTTPLHATPVSMVSQMGTGSVHMGGGSGSFAGCDVNLNEAVPEPANFGSFAAGAYLPPFGGGGGFGLGTGPGLHGMSFGLGMMDWPMESVVVVGGNGSLGGGSGEGGAGGSGSTSSGGCNTWQINGVEGGLGGDGTDCFGWPDLAISMSGKGLK